MKKSHLLLAACLFTVRLLNAQTLTQTYNEPIAGDVHLYYDFDTVITIPKNTGLNQHWDFSQLTRNTSSVSVHSSTFMAAALAPNYTVFTGAAVAENKGAGLYEFYKSGNAPAQFDWMGYQEPGATIVYSKRETRFVWPVSFGDSFTDTIFATAVPGGALSSTLNGVTSLSATGTGTMTLPNGISYPNIIQLTTSRTFTIVYTAPFSYYGTGYSTVYDYYYPTQKFPLLTTSVEYLDDSFGTYTTITVSINDHITVDVGINEQKFDASCIIYPNPAKDSFSVKLSNATGGNCHLEIYNATGQLIKNRNLGNATIIEEQMSLKGFAPGIYTVKMASGSKQSARRLIIE